MILSNITSPIKVVAVSRMNRRTTTASHMDSLEDSHPSITYVPSLSVSLTFEGQKIPNHVFMFYVRYPVSPYIARVSRCNQCFRFGHIQNNCKSQPRCAHCGDKGHTYSKDKCQRAQNLPNCVNCQGEHRADSPHCPELSIQKEIRKYAAYRNVSLLDAKEIFKDPSCSCGYPMQDADHILWNCPLYHAQRTSLLAQLAKLKKNPPFKIQDILKKTLLWGHPHIILLFQIL
ncbi:uncharacterized protein LOC115242161 [Formica exsecta]|uniref:uncharacterized protein LOC115242161 n=1 Tax=Formica exsecta TaxID=72781 RepID=UPI00114508FF|nr:uncharacterized protein LOC115242161 [Formica exsecta]